MASVNKVILVGNLGRDPETRYAASGAPVCNITLATTRHWKDRNTGERQEETEWHRVVLYDRLAEIASEYLKKGSSCFVEGRLRTRKWQDRDGLDRYTTEIIATSLQLLGSKDSAGQESGGDDDSEYRQAKRAPVAQNRTPATTSSNTSFDDMDDDIPF